MIIIEGVDCSGKTTFANKLLRELNNSFLIRRGDIPRSSDQSEIGRLKRSYKTVYDLYKKTIRLNRSHLIVERFYPSEMVYSLVKRNYEGFEDRFYESFENEIVEELGEEVLIIYVFSDNHTLNERLSSRGDDYINKEDIFYLNQRYLKFLENTKVNVFSVNGDDKYFNNAINFIKLKINEA